MRSRPMPLFELTETVLELSMPTVVVAGSFLTAMKEFQAEGRGGPEDDTMIGAEIREWQGRWGAPEGFAAYVAALRAQSEEETPPPAGWVSCTARGGGGGPGCLGRSAVGAQRPARIRRTGRVTSLDT